MTQVFDPLSESPEKHMQIKTQDVKSHNLFLLNYKQ